MKSISDRIREIAGRVERRLLGHGGAHLSQDLLALANELDQKAGEATATADALGRKSNLSIFTEITELRDLAASIGSIQGAE